MDRRNDIDWGGWILTVIMLGAFWPVGLVLLFRQLSGYSRKGYKKQVKRHPADVAREQQARDTYAQTAQRGAQNFTQSAQSQGRSAQLEGEGVPRPALPVQKLPPLEAQGPKGQADRGEDAEQKKPRGVQRVQRLL